MRVVTYMLKRRMQALQKVVPHVEHSTKGLVPLLGVVGQNDAGD